jgi:Na+-driven multidrug efflux pump
LKGILKTHISMKNLLTVTAIFEFGTGLVLLALPSFLISLLLDSAINTPVELTLARVAGVAILSLAVACWLARYDEKSSATVGLVSAMVIYNIAIVLVLVYAALGLALSCFGLWLVVLLHTAMAIWCIMKLLK